jgi:hypothetical protein
MEIEVTATATIETGGGFSDEPAWAMVYNIEINSFSRNGTYMEVNHGIPIYNECIQAATEEFSE